MHLVHIQSPVIRVDRRAVIADPNTIKEMEIIFSRRELKEVTRFLFVWMWRKNGRKDSVDSASICHNLCDCTSRGEPIEKQELPPDPFEYTREGWRLPQSGRGNGGLLCVVCSARRVCRVENYPLIPQSRNHHQKSFEVFTAVWNVVS